MEDDKIRTENENKNKGITFEQQQILDSLCEENKMVDQIQDGDQSNSFTFSNASGLKLHSASCNGQITAVKNLLKNPRCAVNAQDINGDTPLHLAIANSQVEVIDLLLTDQRTDATILNHKNNSSLSSLWDTLILREQIEVERQKQKTAPSLKETSDLINLLLSPDFDESKARKLIDPDTSLLTTADANGLTPLHFIAKRGSGKAVTLLISYDDVDVNAITKKDLTPLHIAAHFGRLETVKLLLELRYVDLNALDVNCDTAAHHAAAGGHVQVLLRLHQDYRCIIEEKNDEERTALEDLPVKYKKYYTDQMAVREKVGPEKFYIEGEDLDTLYSDFLKHYEILPENVAGSQLNGVHYVIYVYVINNKKKDGYEFIENNKYLSQCQNIEVVSIKAPKILSCLKCDEPACSTVQDPAEKEIPKKPWIGNGSEILAIEHRYWKSEYKSKWLLDNKTLDSVYTDIRLLDTNPIAERWSLGYIHKKEDGGKIVTCFHGLEDVQHGKHLVFLTEFLNLRSNMVCVHVLYDGYRHSIQGQCKAYYEPVKGIDILVIPLVPAIEPYAATKLPHPCSQPDLDVSLVGEHNDVRLLDLVTKRGAVTDVTHGYVIAHEMQLKCVNKQGGTYSTPNVVSAFAVGPLKVTKGLNETITINFAELGDSGSLVVSDINEQQGTPKLTAIPRGIVWRRMEVKNETTQSKKCPLEESTVCMKLKNNLDFLEQQA